MQLGLFIYNKTYTTCLYKFKHVHIFLILSIDLWSLYIFNNIFVRRNLISSRKLCKTKPRFWFNRNKSVIKSCSHTVRRAFVKINSLSMKHDVKTFDICLMTSSFLRFTLKQWKYLSAHILHSWEWQRRSIKTLLNLTKREIP